MSSPRVKKTSECVKLGWFSWKKISKNHISLYFTPNCVIIFLFCRYWAGEQSKNIKKILEINFDRKKLPEVTLYARTAFTRKWCWEKFFLPICCVEWHGEQLLFQSWPRIHYCLSYRIFWNAMAKFNIMPFYTLFSKIHISLCIRLNFMIFFLFCRSWVVE